MVKELLILEKDEEVRRLSEQVNSLKSQVDKAQKELAEID
jgi:hypothetical protein